MKHLSRSRYVRPMPYPDCVCPLQAWISATVFLSVSMAVAAPPIEPTLPPYYSFDCTSPAVANGKVGCADVLIPGPNDTPIIVLLGEDIGLGQAGDDLDALSGPSSELVGNQDFALLVSVDRTSRGAVPPDPNLVAQGVPYNVSDQAAKGQAAGDQCMSLDLFTRAGGPLPDSNGRAGDNNALIRNNYNEGGTGFGADPPTSAEESAAARGVPVLQDNVDCMFGTRVPTDPRGPADLLPFYFSASADSPSLPLLPAPIPSGASIFFYGDLQGGAEPQTQLYASFAELGLVQGDDISGMIVIDAGDVGVFGAGDQVILSLAPGSPSLMMIGGPGKVASSADVFSVDGSGNVVIFAAAAGLGLDAADNISAIDFLLCNDATACALLHGIRRPPIPAVSTWGMIITTMLVLAIGTLVFMKRRAIAA